MELVFVGAGRLATQLAQALSDKGGHRIVAVYSRTMASAQALAQKVGAEAADSLSALLHHLPFPDNGVKGQRADAIIIAVKDDALPTVASQIANLNPSCPVFHTAGSIPAATLGDITHYGVIYPMQTFSKERRVDFSRVPFFIEASDDETLAVARAIAASVSSSVTVTDSEQRRRLHLAAVFACNFANHCYTLAADILENCGLDFTVMLPLIEETAAKVETMHPRESQTGPAVRYDQTVMQQQMQMLADMPVAQQVYRLMSDSIHRHATG